MSGISCLRKPGVNLTPPSHEAGQGATHFLMKRLKNVRTEIALSVLTYNLTRVINILGITPLIQAIRA
ncbi:MAG: hypothetical protein ACRBM6_33075 [Geminicoccales bacterium]